MNHFVSLSDGEAIAEPLYRELDKPNGFLKNRSGGNLNGKETLAFRTAFKYIIGNNTSLDFIAN